MKKSLLSGLSALAFVAAVSCTSSTPEIRWTEGAAGKDGRSIHKIVIENARMLPEDWAIWFSQMQIGADVAVGSDATIEVYNGSLHRIRPVAGSGKDSLVILYRAAPLKRRSWAPEGFVLQDMESPSITGTALKAEYRFLPLEPDGKIWQEYNASLEVRDVKPYETIPAVKKIEQEPFALTSGAKPRGWYAISIDGDGKTSFISEDEEGSIYAEATLSQLRSTGEPLHDIYIEDWPDLQYRGFMLDVARNFTSADNVKRLIDVLARYKVNYLHLHLADDEGWRIAVKDIPELTSVGAFHCLDPYKGLMPSYDGCADPSSPALSNGFFTVEDYIGILQHAWRHRISVIPEVDTPGHSRAAIYAMNAYEKRTGDSSMRLQDPADTSRYYGAQGYTDNVMSVELESVYTFIGRIFDEFIALHKKAGVPLEAMNIGGDEVPHGAWNGRNLHPMFLGRVADIAAEKGVKIAGWQEVALCADPRTAEKLRKVMFANYVWNTSGNDSLPYDIASKGYPTVLSNVDYTYADQAYSANRQETAHDWACFIDDTKSLDIPLHKADNVIGVQIQLFTETVRSFDDVCYDCFPKVTGIFERGWNIDSRLTKSDLYSLITAHEMPWWDRNGIAFHIPQPGMVRQADGTIATTSAIPGAKVEITPDGRHAAAHYLSARSHLTTLE